MARVTIPSVQNLLTRSEELDNAAWNAPNAITVTANQATAPDGTVTADQLTASGGANRHYAAQAISVPAAYQFSPRLVTISCYLKRFSSSFPWVAIGNERHTDFVYAWFNLITGATGSMSADNNTAIMIGSSIDGQGAAGGGNWYRCSLTFIMRSPSGGAGMTAESILIGPTPGDGTQVFTPAGDPEKCFAWGASMAIGTNRPGPYVQTVGSAVNTGSIRSQVGLVPVGSRSAISGRVAVSGRVTP